MALLLAGCGKAAAPEDEIRALVSRAEVAAEQRSIGGLGELLAADYRDEAGRDATDIRRLLHGYLIAHQSIRLLTRIESLELLGPEVARVTVSIGMLGREAGAGSALDLAADAYRVDLRLAQSDGEWRITRADWRRAGSVP